MKIALCGSIDFYLKMDDIKSKLVSKGHIVFHPRDTALPSIDRSFNEQSKSDMSEKTRQKKNQLIKSHLFAIKKSDAILVVNLHKNGIDNYIGGNTFLEMGFALAYDKKIFILNPVAPCSYIDEITGMLPIILNGKLDKIDNKKL